MGRERRHVIDPEQSTESPGRPARATLNAWLRQSELPPARPTVAAVISVSLCAAYQALLAAVVLFTDGASYPLARGLPASAAVALVAVGAAVLLILRSRVPLAILIVECGLYVAASMAGMHDLLLFPLLFALYSCVTRPPLWQVATGIGAVVASMTFSAAAVTAAGRFGAEYLGQLVTAAAVIALAIAARSMRGWWRSQSRAIAEEERARLLVAQRDRAVSRTRIAAELHDSVGHGLTTIIALAEGLAGTTGDPELDEALAGINTVARSSLTDTRRALRALSEADEATAVDAEPEPSISHDWDEILAVIDNVRTLGVSVDFAEAGRRATNPDQADLCFAVTREALTNAVRHSRGLTHVAVSWGHGTDGSTRATIRSVAEPSEADPKATRGTGLCRLRDRIESRGGTLTFGHTDAGEWTVEAVIVGSIQPADRQPADRRRR